MSLKSIPIRLGIDLGGTKIEIIALDSDGSELLRRRVSTPQGDYAATLQAILGLVQSAEREFELPVTVGIGTPGAISKSTGMLKNSNSVHLNGKPLLKDLETLLARPVRISNDANCFALSEATDGAGEGESVVFGVIIGTGTGGGVVVNGHVLTGPNAIAGEWGHNPLPWPNETELPGADCYCGKQGCIETFLSGPGMARQHLIVTGKNLNSETIVERALAGDALCEQTLKQYEDRLARSLAQVINILDPDVIVLGGGMSNIDRLFDNVPRLLPQYVFSDRVDTKLLKNKHGDSSGVRGAAWLWNE
ncbi:ROK family protein [Sulfurirhabdus autotrophica]|uniref:N-acetylglucosamine kinase n=1 Tax=Sulfurirhabdus autotrophica TaxID=1706046 RepID=A0A4R3YAL9_9PROT|nr:ROK family protein [Sulfurirhabdus autotrophica]TCV87423.1 N-acetylglucosamine kinase [Sulfurirhabdus autotrophica]